ncbi:hypothetical protein [uncultured Gilliamella sp.]|uniref:hypothetical protein n=1 Tax=uncultured Gilliamella sp. TaxID=1193505 RepID=UPI0025E57677|nr:hypothetical protein [uncultured Gilliamella sp.]
MSITIDVHTILFDVTAENNIIVYHYKIKGIARKFLMSPKNKQQIRQGIVESYCKEIPQMKRVKKIF